MTFTFVNISDGPALSKQAAKQMRGHVTKVNFAERRERKRTGGRVPTHVQGRGSISGPIDPLKRLGNTSYASHDELVGCCPGEPGPRRLKLLKSLEAIILQGRSSKADSWHLSLIYSQPALAEAMLSVIVRYYTSPAFECCKFSSDPSMSQAFPRRLLAELHSRRALALAIEQVGSQKGHTDGLLETVETLALSAKFSGDSGAYEVHVGGMVDILRSRREKGITHIPAPLRDEIILYGLFDRVLGYSRLYHDRIVDEASHTHPIISSLATVTQDLARFRRQASLIRSSSYKEAHCLLPSRLENLRMRLFIWANALRLYDNMYVRAVAVAVDMILRINSPARADQNIESYADELQEIMSQFPHRWCALMDVTSSLMWLGAVVARRGSDAAEWFTGRLKAGMGVLRSTEWEVLCDILYSELRGDSLVYAAKFKEKWREVGGEELPVPGQTDLVEPYSPRGVTAAV